MDWISWGKKGEDFAGLAEISGEGKKKKKVSGRARKIYWRKKKKEKKKWWLATWVSSTWLKVSNFFFKIKCIYPHVSGT